jgi:hypothetical protein
MGEIRRWTGAQSLTIEVDSILVELPLATRVLLACFLLTTAARGEMVMVQHMLHRVMSWLSRVPRTLSDCNTLPSSTLSRFHGAQSAEPNAIRVRQPLQPDSSH